MLEKMELPQQYKIGHDGIDEQHAYLFAILIEIVTICKNVTPILSKKTDAEIHDVLKNLQKYTQNHFQYEERLMEKMKYPDLENHRAIHGEFIKRMLNIQKEAIRKKETKFLMIHEMAVLVKEWLINHIQIEDKKLNTFLKDFEDKKKYCG